MSTDFNLEKRIETLCSDLSGYLYQQDIENRADLAMRTLMFVLVMTRQLIGEEEYSHGAVIKIVQDMLEAIEEAKPQPS